MELTKIEKRILSPKHEKMGKWALWGGIFFLCLSIVPVPFMINNINSLKETWEKSYSFLDQEINPETNQEISLKSMLLKNIMETKELYITHFTEKTVSMVLNFFLISCFLIGYYFMSRNYTNLIRKLQNS